MTEFNLPLGIYRSTRGDLDLKFRVATNIARDLLITKDLVKEGHLIYNEEDKELQYLKSYPTFASVTGVVWEAVNSLEDFLLHSNNTNNTHQVTISQVGLSQVDNTRDVDKPVSSPQQVALNTKFDKSGGTITGNVSIAGDLTVSGNLTQVNGEINSQDTVIQLNDGEIGSGVTGGFSGLSIDRGSITDAWIGWDEVRDNFTLGLIPDLTPSSINSTEVIATREDVMTSGDFLYWSGGKISSSGINPSQLTSDVDSKFDKIGGSLTGIQNINLNPDAGEVSIDAKSGNWTAGFTVDEYLGSGTLGGFNIQGSGDSLINYYVGESTSNNIVEFYPNQTSIFKGAVTAPNFIGDWNGETKSEILSNVAYTNTDNEFTIGQTFNQGVILPGLTISPNGDFLGATGLVLDTTLGGIILKESGSQIVNFSSAGATFGAVDITTSGDLIGGRVSPTNLTAGSIPYYDGYLKDSPLVISGVNVIAFAEFTANKFLVGSDEVYHEGNLNALTLSGGNVTGAVSSDESFSANKFSHKDKSLISMPGSSTSGAWFVLGSIGEGFSKIILSTKTDGSITHNSFAIEVGRSSTTSIKLNTYSSGTVMYITDARVMKNGTDYDLEIKITIPVGGVNFNTYITELEGYTSGVVLNSGTLVQSLGSGVIHESREFKPKGFNSQSGYIKGNEIHTDLNFGKAEIDALGINADKLNGRSDTDFISNNGLDLINGGSAFNLDSPNPNSVSIHTVTGSSTNSPTVQGGVFVSMQGITNGLSLFGNTSNDLYYQVNSGGNLGWTKLWNESNFDPSTKVDKVVGKGLSDENYTLVEKNKLSGIEASADVNRPISDSIISSISTTSASSNAVKLVNDKTIVNASDISDLDTNKLNKTGDGSQLTNVNAKYIEGYNKDQFLRSDANDRFNGGTLALDNDSVLAFGRDNHAQFVYSTRILFTNFNSQSLNWYIKQNNVIKFNFELGSGNFEAAGDITANAFFGDGSQLTGIPQLNTPNTYNKYAFFSDDSFSAPSSGKGLQLGMYGGVASLLSYDRDNNVYTPLIADGGDISFKTNGNERFVINGAGNFDLKGGNLTNGGNVTAESFTCNTSNEITGSDAVIKVVSLTQAEYDAGTPNATTLYIIK